MKDKNLMELAEAIRASRSLPKDDFGMTLVASEVVEAVLSYITKIKPISFDDTTEFYAETGIDDEDEE